VNDKTADASNSTDVIVVEPSTSEEEARSKDFADLMAAARALKPGDLAGAQDFLTVTQAILLKAAGMAARDKITPLQAQMVVEAIKKSTGFPMAALSKTFKKYFKTEQEEARKEAEAKAAAAGPGGAGGAGSAGGSYAGASSSGSYAGSSGQYYLDEHGLFWRRDKKWEKIAGPFEILGLARNTEEEEWGKLLRFKNADGHIREEIINEETLRVDPHSVAARLVSCSMWVSGISAEQRAFLEYLMLEFVINERVTRTRTTGWIKLSGERAFVLPNETIGASGTERIALNQRGYASYAQRGTLGQWREAIAKPAGSHLMMRISIAISLAGTLLDFGDFESGLLHFWGSSGAGKTTMQRIVASSWGSGADGGFMRAWRTTANALEGTLASMSDTVLVLDEIAQAEGRDIGAVVYMIAGAVGKTRMRSDASIKPSYKWRVLALSSGEYSIASKLGEEQKAKRAHAGQLVRAIDIPEGRALGMFDRVSPDLDAEAFARELLTSTATFYGTAGPEFVRQLIERRIASEQVCKLVDEFVATALKGVDKKNHGQVARVARRFGLIATAGHFAIEFGIAPWPKHQVAKDALELFKAWFEARGGAAPAEIGHKIEKVRGFIERYGDSRFDSLDPPPNNPSTGYQSERRPVNDRAGWRKGAGEDRRWYVLPVVWRTEVCAGFDPRDVAKTLAARGMLEPGESGRMSQNIRIFDIQSGTSSATQRVYVLTPAIFEAWGR
jgi:putative DNA primase/helicase